VNVTAFNGERIGTLGSLGGISQVPVLAVKSAYLHGVLVSR